MSLDDRANDEVPGIGEHGLIGDLRSAALVNTDARVSWFCPGRFDSPSVFHALLDEEEGGRWDLRPAGEVAQRQQFYFPDSNVLVTRFLTPDGIVEVEDFMVIVRAGDADHRQRLVRRVRSVRGCVRLRTRVAPRFDFGRADHTAEPASGGVRFTGPDLTLALRSTIPLDLTDGDATAEFEVADGARAAFVLEAVLPSKPGTDDRDTHRETHCDTDVEETARDLFDTTVAFWRAWLSRSTYSGRWREMVHRSALTLKMLTHEPSGAVIAAPTMGLPEQIGGTRNWDYRYVWIRDAAFSLYALLRLGFTGEADAFIGWLSRCISSCDQESDGADGPLRVMYSIDGEAVVEETELGHCRASAGQARCSSATPPPPSCSSTSTAS